MPIAGSALARTSSRLAVATRTRDPEQIAEARREHVAAQIEAYIERVVAEAPPLTDAQRSRLATLLNGGAS